MRLCWHKEEAHLGKGSGPDGCLPACYASHSKSRRDGGVPAFTRMLSNTMTLDETYPTEQVWWFLDIRTYLSVLCAVYYPDELGDMLLSHPYSRPVLVRSAERGNLGTQRELHSFVYAMMSGQGKHHVRRQAAGGKHIPNHTVMTTPRFSPPCRTKGVGQGRRKGRISEVEAPVAPAAAEKEVV